MANGDSAFIAPIVEGHGEQEALEALLHRIVRSSAGIRRLQVNPPIRVSAGSFLNDRSYFDRYVRSAAAKAAVRNGSVLILLDCDVDSRGRRAACPAELGPRLLSQARAARPDVPMFVALANREYEAWLIASVASMRGLYGLPSNIDPPADPEGIRGAKEWLSRHMSEPYDPVTHQTPMTRQLDPRLSISCPSFQRLYNHVASLVL